jgi:hypothetical protein
MISNEGHWITQLQDKQNHKKGRKTDENNNKNCPVTIVFVTPGYFALLASMQASQSSAGRRLSRGIGV